MATSTVSAVLRSDQAYYAQLSEPFSLDWGIAYSSPRFAELPACNQFREFTCERAADVASAFAAVEAYFAERGLRCGRWTPAAGQPVEHVGAFLGGRGFARREMTVLALREWPALAVRPDVRVLPARAMPKAVSAIFAERFARCAGPLREACLAAARERLDDPRMDGFVAMLGAVPVGFGALFQVGDIGRISDLFVGAANRRQGVATALMDHVLKLARRLTMRVTCVQAPSSNGAAIALCRRCGMEPDGIVPQFIAPGRGDVPE